MSMRVYALISSLYAQRDGLHQATRGERESKKLLWTVPPRATGPDTSGDLSYIIPLGEYVLDMLAGWPWLSEDTLRGAINERLIDRRS